MPESGLVLCPAHRPAWLWPLDLHPPCGYGTICVAELFAEVAHAQAYAALHDVLTELPNRHLFLDRLERARTAVAAGEAALFAVLFVDVDEFKSINDVLGHEAGDLALSSVAARLTGVGGGSLRIVVARLGGDEFGVLVEGAADAEEVVGVVEQIVSSLCDPLFVGGDKVALKASVGVAIGDGGCSSSGELLRQADLAMYAAKRRSKGGYAFYEEGMQDQARERLEVRSALDGALERGEFELAYQPIVELDGFSIVGAETLLRWAPADQRAVGPAQFIPICEQSGLIVPVGRWALSRACADAVRWGRAHPGHAPLKVSVNISPRQLLDAGFVSDVDRILRVTGMPRGALVLEITEGVFIDDTDDAPAVLDRLAALKRLGVMLALDDFGAGFSSLGRLSRMPIDLLKLDRAFVAQLEDGAGRSLVRGVVAMARSLEVLTLAEGVETWDQVVALQAAGCQRAQGYYFARPMSGQSYAALFGEARVMPTLPAVPWAVAS